MYLTYTSYGFGTQAAQLLDLHVCNFYLTGINVLITNNEDSMQQRLPQQ